MSEFLKNLETALAGKVLIESPKNEFGKHLSSMIYVDEKGQNITSHLKQFVCTPPNIVNEGPAIENQMFNPDKEFTIEHIQKLTELISNFSKRISFVPLVLPYSLIKAELHRHNHIIGRYLEAYSHNSDDIMKRWDFLILKLDF